MKKANLDLERRNLSLIIIIIIIFFFFEWERHKTIGSTNWAVLFLVFETLTLNSVMFLFKPASLVQ